ncbi:hypothetical protein HWV62_27387 [Athelia sp. TMB]|nr:hypothetical protein HWV62_27387 [Athelia sp. TMB]
MRICVRSGALADAHYILKSLFQSAPSCSPPSTSSLPFRFPRLSKAPRSNFVPLDFRGQVIDPKLAAHTLVHELLRMGLTTKAYLVAQNLLKSELVVHPKTLHAVVTHLLAESASPPSPLSYLRAPPLVGLLFSSKVLALNPRAHADPATRYAVRLIQHAQHHRARYSAATLEAFIRYFLRRGELLFAALFVGMIVRDYAARQAAAMSLRGEIACAPPEEKAGLQKQMKQLAHEKIPVDKTLICQLATDLRKALLAEPLVSATDDPESDSQLPNLQTLATLASLLDARLLPFGDIAPLIKALYSVPVSSSLVWVLTPDGRVLQVPAHAYVHGVLLRLCEDLPDAMPPRRLKKGEDPPKKWTPPLDTYAYNTLVHYALRHRLDPELAAQILAHMKGKSRPEEKQEGKKARKSLNPDVVTHNIVLRAGTLSRHNALAEGALSSLRARRTEALAEYRRAGKENGEIEQKIGGREGMRGLLEQADVKFLANDGKPVLGEKAEQIPMGTKPHADMTPDLWALKLLPLAAPTPAQLYTADAHTLTSYIAHLTATGRPHAVAPLLFFLLPELALIDHPSWGCASPEEIAALKKAQAPHIQRAVALGPRFFVAVLNALAKAGRTGLAERVWLLAKRAELLSWRLRDTSPWLLPVHAYTIMLQAYHTEIHHCRREPARVGQHDAQQRWAPAAAASARGWAKYIHDTQDARDPARRAALRLFHAMRDGGRAVCAELLALQAHSAPGTDAVVPVPDARFFNAALALFPVGPARAAPRAHFARRMRRARATYAAGEPLRVRGRWSGMLSVVAREMVAHGYAVPLGLRPMLLGRWEHAAFVGRPRTAVDTRPYAFVGRYPRVGRTFRAHGLSVLKTRGLPVRRKARRKGSLP